MSAAPAFDLVVLADPRLRYGEGRCLAALLRVAAGAGWRTGLLPVQAPLAGRRVWHPAVSALVAAGQVALLDGEQPHAVGLLLAYHLPALSRPFPRPLLLCSGAALLRVDQPWRASDGRLLLSLPAGLERLRVLAGCEPTLAAADPLLAARLGVEGCGEAPLWPPVSDLPFAEPRPAGPAGRHVAGGEAAWPVGADLGAAYGGPVLLAEAAARHRPSGLAAGPMLRAAELADPAAVLGGLGGYLMATSPAWEPVLLPGLAEVLAVGLPIAATPSLAPLLGPAAQYAPAAELAAVPRARDRQTTEAARHLHAELTSPAALLRRLADRLGRPAPTTPALRLRRDLRARKRLIFLSPNGVGMGHLTRLLAVARRLPAELEPVFLSMSQAVGVVEAFGYVGEHIPYHAYTGESAEAWSRALQARLAEAIAFYDARAVVFDGNEPYRGLIDCRAAHPERGFAWLRRGLWRRDAGRASIDRARHFDLVLEPAELAAELDGGTTAGRRAEAVQVPPVLLLDPAELLDRTAARAALGIDPGHTAVLIQLGGRNNFDYSAIEQAMLDELLARPEIEPVVVDWLIGEKRRLLPPRVRRLETFPIARHYRAFDLAVSAAGYNSFHELLACGVPTIFVPNENPMMDAQELRALWAERNGLALLVRCHEPYRMAWALRRLLAPELRETISRRCAALPACDGAARIAACLAELASSLRLDEQADRLPRSGLHGLESPVRRG